MLRFTYKALKKGIFNTYVLIGLLVALAFIAGIFANKKIFAPDLHRLYMESMMVTDQPPVIFIHGVLGSRLKDTKTKEDIWPGAISRLFSHDYSDAAYKITPDTLEPKLSNAAPYGIFDGAAGQDFYGKIVHTLSDVGGYKLTKVGKKVNAKQKNYYVFLYDWRQDNVKSASELADFIEQVRLDYDNPKLKVDIVAHSMGGLIARYYIRYGKQDVINDNDFDKKLTMYGAERVRRVILLGTPNLGSISSLSLFITGLDIGVNQIATETLASMPSLYQLFPHALNNWIVTRDGKPLERDLYDVHIWRSFKWSIFDPKVRQRISEKYDNKKDAEQHLVTFERYFEKNLERARRFAWSLSVATPRPEPKLIVFGGGCTLTPARILVEEVDG